MNGVTDDDFFKSLLYEAQTIRVLKEKFLNCEKVRMARKKKSTDKEENKRVLSSSSRVDKRAEQRCYNCGHKGYLARACAQTLGGPKCFSCREYDHKASECARNKSVVPTKINVTEESVGMVDIVLNKTSVKALFDSGSNQNLVTIGCYSIGH